MVFAGLWETWTDNNSDQSKIESCTILTMDAMGEMREIHERTPVILEPEGFDLWLKADISDTKSVEELLKPFDGQL